MKGFKLNDEQRQDVEGIYNFLRLLACRTAGSLQRDWDQHFIDDLTQQAVVWACKACESFDRNNGTKFISYATKWIPKKMRFYAQTAIEKSSDSQLEEEPRAEYQHDDLLIDVLPIIKGDKYELVRRYFGFGQDPETHSQIADSLGISRQLVGRKINRLLVAIYKNICGSNLEI